MSSVIVKDMEMPDSCYHCKIAESCRHYITNYSNRRPNDCPLIALPDKHGRLVDLDALKEDLRIGKECDKDCPTDWKACHYDRVYAKQDFCIWLDDADTIVEAEGEE